MQAVDGLTMAKQRESLFPVTPAGDLRYGLNGAAFAPVSGDS